MRVAVIGAGGMGGYFGGLLARGGAEVVMLARGPRLQAIVADGVRLTSPVHGDFVAHVAATDDPAQLGPVDAVLVCVKTYDVDAVAQILPTVVQPGTLVVPVQNGVGAAERLAEACGPAVLGGVSWVTAHAEAPGEFAHLRGTRLLVGELAGGLSARVAELCAGLVGAGVDAVVTENIQVARWEKLLGICVVASLAGVTRLPLGTIFGSAGLRDVAQAMLAEIVAVAQALGIELGPDAVARSLATLDGMAASAPGAYPSLYQDLVHGRRIEVDSLSGAVVRMGQETGVATPVTALLTALLSPYRDGTPALPSS
jgi:2-dehydropantoate 2-reductase